MSFNSSRISKNLYPMSGESLDGLSTTVFPVTTAAEVIPTRIASTLTIHTLK